MAKKQTHKPLEAPQIWDAYRALKTQQGTPPSVRAMAGRLGVGPSTLYQRMHALARRGEEMPPIGRELALAREQAAVATASEQPMVRPPSPPPAPEPAVEQQPDPIPGLAHELLEAVAILAMLARVLGVQSITVSAGGTTTTNR